MTANEIQANLYVDHPHVTRVLQMIDSKLYFYLVLEYIAGGNVKTVMHDCGGFTDSQVFKIVKQLLLGVNALHEAGICHRDLKTENLLCDKEFEDNAPVIHIADFGHAMFLNENYTTKQIQVGTRYYMAPELLEHSESDGQLHYNEKVDIWAIGVITYYLVREGKFPFPGKKKAIVENLILNQEPDFDFDCSDERKQFIKDCLNKKYELRPSARELIDRQGIFDDDDEPATPVSPMKSLKQGIRATMKSN